MKAAREELAALLFAIQFLTRVPIPLTLEFNEARQKNAIGYYPLAGGLVGIFAAAVWFGAYAVFPGPIPVLLSIIAGLTLTGALHEDGLADTMDGLGGKDAAASLEIMRDSRVGVFGAVGLISILAVKAAALAALPAAILPASLLLAHIGSRVSLVIVVATSRYAGAEPEFKPTAKGVGGGGLLKSLLTGFAVSALAWAVVPLAVLGAALAGLALGHVASRLLYERKLRGYTGDCLGATQQVSELGVYLGLLAAL